MLIVLLTRARHSFTILSKINPVHTLHISSTAILILLSHLRVKPIEWSCLFKCFSSNFLLVITIIHYKLLHRNCLTRILFFLLISTFYIITYGEWKYIFIIKFLLQWGSVFIFTIAASVLPVSIWTRGWLGSTCRFERSLHESKANK